MYQPPAPQSYGPTPQQTALGQVHVGAGLNQQNQQAAGAAQNAFVPSPGVLNAARMGALSSPTPAFTGGMQGGLGVITQNGAQTLQGMRDYRGTLHAADQIGMQQSLAAFLDNQELQQRLNEIALKRALGGLRGQNQMIGAGINVAGQSLGAYGEYQKQQAIKEQDAALAAYLKSQASPEDPSGVPTWLG